MAGSDFQIARNGLAIASAPARGSAASVTARTTQTRRAPAAQTSSRFAPSTPPMANHGFARCRWEERPSRHNGPGPAPRAGSPAWSAWRTPDRHRSSPPARCYRGIHLLPRVGRAAEQRPPVQLLPGLLRRPVGLAEMQHVGPEPGRQDWLVVDTDDALERLRRRAGYLQGRDQPPAQGPTGELHDVAPPRKAPVKNWGRSSCAWRASVHRYSGGADSSGTRGVSATPANRSVLVTTTGSPRDGLRVG